MNKADLKAAVQAALEGDWHTAHNIAQDYSDGTANWIHAVLHKIEGDAGNSRYWYAHGTGHHYEDFADSALELQAILQTLED
jgi:hypothetical protein